MLLERFERDAAGMAQWAEDAKRCVDFFEGKQWSPADIAYLEARGLPHLTINEIKPLVMLVLGYHRNNRTDAKFLPTGDSIGSEQTAKVLSEVVKAIHNQSRMPHVDSEVFLDGILTGRGYYKSLLDFQKNDFGEARFVATDPFATFPDTDADTYDPEGWTRYELSRWLSVDEISAFYGEQAGAYAASFLGGPAYGGMTALMNFATQEVSPRRTFGQSEGFFGMPNVVGYEQMFDYVDTMRKMIRVIETEYVVYVDALVFIDLETGARILVPDHWTRQKIEATLAWAASIDNPLTLERRRVKRIRTTHLAGDLMVWDGWSRQETMSLIPFFPYFRRGTTLGMVHDLVDPQKEINKNATNELTIQSRTANGGWEIPKGSLDSENMERLKRFGARAGLILEWDATKTNGERPRLLEQQQPGPWYERREQRLSQQMKRISLINDSALGELDKVQSGRALEARQRQTIIGIEPYMENYNRTQEMKADKSREMVQLFYTEQRLIRLRGDNGQVNDVMINQQDPATGAIINNVTLGRYEVTIDQTPLSAQFLSAVFEELIRLREIGVPVPDDFIIDASSTGRKEEMKQRIAAAVTMQATQSADPLTASAQPAAPNLQPSPPLGPAANVA